MPNPSPNEVALPLETLTGLMGLCASLIKNKGQIELDDEEFALTQGSPDPQGIDLDRLADQIRAGDDVLGREYCRLKTAPERRHHGATFTPDRVVSAMVQWALAHHRPQTIVDPGAGSARYAIAAAQAFPDAQVIAVEIDPMLRVIAKTRILMMGLNDRIQVHPGSFLTMERPASAGRMLFIGNPPYVRHHDISVSDKNDFTQRCQALNVPITRLAGLHLHFMIKMFVMAQPGDAMAVITAAEWLETNYGRGLRHLLASGAHTVSVDSFAKDDLVFDDALVAATIVCVRFNDECPSVRIGTLVADSTDLGRGVPWPVDQARSARSWNDMVTSQEAPGHSRVLGDLFRVSRGLSTGMNAVWIVSRETPHLPDRFLHPCITQSEDISTASGYQLSSSEHLSKVILLPETLDGLSNVERDEVEAFLDWARARGADQTFTARQRKVWWSIAHKETAPIVMTYMGRRPPVFAFNTVRAQFLNIAHGLYPKVALTDDEVKALVVWLNQNVSTKKGRAYAGGLVKFEPSEAMQLVIPTMKELIDHEHHQAATIAADTGDLVL